MIAMNETIKDFLIEQQDHIRAKRFHTVLEQLWSDPDMSTQNAITILQMLYESGVENIFDIRDEVVDDALSRAAYEYIQEYYSRGIINLPIFLAQYVHSINHLGLKLSEVMLKVKLKGGDYGLDIINSDKAITATRVKPEGMEIIRR